MPSLILLKCYSLNFLLWCGVVGGYIVFLGLISIFVVVYLVCFYMWLRVLISRKVAIYSDGDNIIIIIIIIMIVFFWFKV